MGLGGKPARKFTPQEIEQLRTFGGIRLPMEYIAQAFGLGCKDTLEHMLKKDDAARSALEKGRSSASQNARGTLYTLAMGVKDKKGKYRVKPSLRALEFWCRTQEGFKSADRVELTGADGGPIETSEESREERLKRIAELNKKLALTKDE